MMQGDRIREFGMPNGKTADLLSSRGGVNVGL
jgi:hypothetical protein